MLRPVVLSPEHIDFPPPTQALETPNGLLAIGGDLRPERLLQAYRQGIFPWYSEPDPICWWSPNPRCVLNLTELKITRSLRQSLRRPYHVTCNQHFPELIHLCGQQRQANTWIGPAMQQAYVTLHQLGHAHSVEVFDQQQRLVGGLYGVSVGQCFFGESMVSLVRDASKIALVRLRDFLRAQGVEWIDCQVGNEHLIRLGARNIPRKDFLRRLDHGIQEKNTVFTGWEHFSGVHY